MRFYLLAAVVVLVFVLAGCRGEPVSMTPAERYAVGTEVDSKLISREGVEAAGVRILAQGGAPKGIYQAVVKETQIRGSRYELSFCLSGNSLEVCSKQTFLRNGVAEFSFQAFAQAEQDLAEQVKNIFGNAKKASLPARLRHGEIFVFCTGNGV